MRVTGTPIAALALALTLGACVALFPRPSPPEVRGVALRVVQVALPTARFGVDVRLYNPNREPLAIANLVATLRIDDEVVGEARLSDAVTLAATSETTVGVDVVSDLSSVAGAVVRSLLSGRSELRYEISGWVDLVDGRRFPFMRRGSTEAWRGGLG